MTKKKTLKLSILIAVFNERIYLPEALDRIRNCPLPNAFIDSLEIVLVDDFSHDGSRQWLTENIESLSKIPRADGVLVTYFLELHNKNQGKGAAIQTALKASSGDIVLIQDADLEYSPLDYPRLIQPILDNVADAVFGSRFRGETRRVLFFWHAVANWLLTTFSNMLTDLNLTDMETCFKAIRGDLARSLPLTSKRFGFEPEITARLSRAEARIYEVPVQYFGRTYEEGKKIGWRDGVAAFWHIFFFNFIDRKTSSQNILTQTLLKLSDRAAELYKPALEKAMAICKLPQNIKILEVGSGLGSITRFLLEKGQVLATDVSSQYVEMISSRFSFAKNLNTKTWDANTEPSFEKNNFDLLVSFNVVEHLKDDQKSLKYFHSVLKPDGKIILLVPWGNWLFGTLDAALEHQKRYSKKTLTHVLENAGFEVTEMFYKNPIAIPGWFFAGKILRKKNIQTSDLKLYLWLKKILMPLDIILTPFFGINLIAVARKKS